MFFLWKKNNGFFLVKNDVLECYKWAALVITESSSTAEGL